MGSFWSKVGSKSSMIGVFKERINIETDTPESHGRKHSDSTQIITGWTFQVNLKSMRLHNLIYINKIKNTHTPFYREYKTWNLPLCVSEEVTPTFRWLSSQSFYFSQLHIVFVYYPDEYWGLRQHSPMQSWASWLWNKGILWYSPVNQTFIRKITNL